MAASRKSDSADPKNFATVPFATVPPNFRKAFGWSGTHVNIRFAWGRGNACEFCVGANWGWGGGEKRRSDRRIRLNVFWRSDRREIGSHIPRNLDVCT